VPELVAKSDKLLETMIVVFSEGAEGGELYEMIIIID